MKHEDIVRSTGYARAGICEHESLDGQTEALEAASWDVVFSDRVSGARSVRPALGQAVAELRTGETRVVRTIDRLGRNGAQLMHLLSALMEHDIRFRSFSGNIDSDGESGRRLRHVPGGMAAMERETARKRARVGMKAAAELGTHVGRPPCMISESVGEARSLPDQGNAAPEAARITGVAKSIPCSAPSRNESREPERHEPPENRRHGRPARTMEAAARRG